MSVTISRKKKNKIPINELLDIDSLQKVLLKNIKISYKIIDYIYKIQDQLVDNLSNDKKDELLVELDYYLTIFGKNRKNMSIPEILINATKLIQETNKIAKSCNIDLYQTELHDTEVVSNDDLEIITTLVQQYGIEIFNKVKEDDEKRRMMEEEQEDSELKIVETDKFIMSG
jgi:hypothetical protein